MPSTEEKGKAKGWVHRPTMERTKERKNKLINEKGEHVTVTKKTPETAKTNKQKEKPKAAEKKRESELWARENVRIHVHSHRDPHADTKSISNNSKEKNRQPICKELRTSGHTHKNICIYIYMNGPPQESTFPREGRREEKAAPRVGKERKKRKEREATGVKTGKRIEMLENKRFVEGTRNEKSIQREKKGRQKGDR